MLGGSQRPNWTFFPGPTRRERAQALFFNFSLKSSSEGRGSFSLQRLQPRSQDSLTSLPWVGGHGLMLGFNETVRLDRQGDSLLVTNSWDLWVQTSGPL